MLAPVRGVQRPIHRPFSVGRLVIAPARRVIGSAERVLGAWFALGLRFRLRSGTGPAGRAGRTAGTAVRMQIAMVAGGPRIGDLEGGAVGAAFGDTVSVVSGGLGCIERCRRVGTPNTCSVHGGFGHLQQCSRLSLSTLGGGGNRTRVLQCITRASPGAACCAFLSPGDHASETPTGSAAVRCPA
jgi:hypothetical protein